MTEQNEETIGPVWFTFAYMGGSSQLRTVFPDRNFELVLVWMRFVFSGWGIRKSIGIAPHKAIYCLLVFFVYACHYRNFV